VEYVTTRNRRTHGPVVSYPVTPDRFPVFRFSVNPPVKKPGKTPFFKKFYPGLPPKTPVNPRKKKPGKNPPLKPGPRFRVFPVKKKPRFKPPR